MDNNLVGFREYTTNPIGVFRSNQIQSDDCAIRALSYAGKNTWKFIYYALACRGMDMGMNMCCVEVVRKHIETIFKFDTLHFKRTEKRPAIGILTKEWINKRFDYAKDFNCALVPCSKHITCIDYTNNQNGEVVDIFDCRSSKAVMIWVGMRGGNL